MAKEPNILRPETYQTINLERISVNTINSTNTTNPFTGKVFTSARRALLSALPPGQRCQGARCLSGHSLAKGYAAHGDCLTYLCGKCLIDTQNSVENIRRENPDSTLQCAVCGDGNFELDEAVYRFCQPMHSHYVQEDDSDADSSS